MHVAWAAFATPITSASGTAAAAAFAFAVVAHTPEVSRIVLRRQQASRPLPAAFANDKSNEARHVA